MLPESFAVVCAPKFNPKYVSLESNFVMYIHFVC